MAPGGRWLLDHLWPPRDGPLDVFSAAQSWGWSVSEASSLAAYSVGLRLSDGDSDFIGWTMPEIMHIRFVRYLWETWRLHP